MSATTVLSIFLMVCIIVMVGFFCPSLYADIAILVFVAWCVDKYLRDGEVIK